MLRPGLCQSQSDEVLNMGSKTGAQDQPHASFYKRQHAGLSERLGS